MGYDPRTRAYYTPGSLSDYTTTGNTYADVGTWAVGHYGTKQMYFTSADNDINVKVLGSFDDGATYPITVEAEFAVATSTPVVKTITALYTHLKVQADPAVDDNHGTLSTIYTGWSR